MCLATIKRIKKVNGKVGQRDATEIPGSCPMLDDEVHPSHFEV